MFDLIIIGAAAAGSAAAVYAARRNLNFLIITKDIGGEVALSGEVENWPGVIHTDGYKLSQEFYEHIKSYNTKIEQGLEVTMIKQEKNYHIISAKDSLGNEKIYETKTVIVASGIHPRNLNIPGEKELRGKGVTYCTVCDGPLYKNKITTTIGAGNAALESALMMASIAKEVNLITKYPNKTEAKGGFPKGEDILIEKVKKIENIHIIYNANTLKINGERKVNSLNYEDADSKEKKSVITEGIMIHAGMIPNSQFVNCINKNALGEIEVDLRGATSCPGIFSAGDVTNIPYKQIVIAAGQGVVAALSAIDYLNRWK